MLSGNGIKMCDDKVKTIKEINQSNPSKKYNTFSDLPTSTDDSFATTPKSPYHYQIPRLNRQQNGRRQNLFNKHKKRSNAPFAKPRS